MKKKKPQIQVYALLGEDSFDWMLYLSLFVSVCVAANMTINIDEKKDAEIVSRRAHPDFFGYIPSGLKKYLVKSCMFGLSFSQLIMKTLTYSLFFRVDRVHCLGIFSADISFFFLYKIVKRDLVYWTPLEGVVSFVVSLLMRFVSKILCDFTMRMYERHSKELGGSYWLFNLFLTYILLLFAVFRAESEGRDWELEGGNTRYVAYGLIAISLTSFISFLSLIEAKYRKTFWIFRSGPDYQKESFYNGDDFVKAEVFLNNKEWYRSYEDDVKRWVVEGWTTWTKHNPNWFTPMVYNNIPVAWMAKAEGDMATSAKGESAESESCYRGDKSKSSIKDLMMTMKLQIEE